MCRCAWKLIITFYHQSLGEKNNLVYFGYVSTGSKFNNIDVKNDKQCTRNSLLLDKIVFENVQFNALTISHICY